MITDDLLTEIRSKFAHVDACPFQGPRVFFENAGGALTLKSVIKTSTDYAGYPDNHAGRDNPAGRALRAAIEISCCGPTSSREKYQSFQSPLRANNRCWVFLDHEHAVDQPTSIAP